MSLPKQTIGLTNFSTSISKCPPNPDAIRAIVFTKCDNLSVVNGAKTEMQISLTDFFIPVTDAARTSFTLPARVANVPYTITKLDLGGVSTDGSVKFIALFPQFGKGASGNSMYLEWATEYVIESFPLEAIEQIVEGGNISFKFYEINKLEFSNGDYLDYDGEGTGCIYAATNGGLLKWDGSKMSLWNTQNSSSSTDFLSSLAVDSANTLWIGSNEGIMLFNENSTTGKNFSMFGTPPSSNILDIKLFSPNLGAASTDEGLYVFSRDGILNETYDIYNSPLLKHNVISKISVSDDNIIFAGTTGGVYALDYSTKKWCKFPLNSSTISGWTGSDEVTAVDSYDNNLYIGTTGGIVVIPYIGITGATSSYAGITASYLSSPLSDNISSLRIASYGNSNYELYVGHGASGGMAIYNFNSSTWNFQTETPIDVAVKDILPNSLSTSGNKTLFMGCTAGITKVLTDSVTLSTVPSMEDSADILLSIPSGGSFSGNSTIDNSKLYSVEQPITILFSKDMANMGASFQNFFSLSQGIDGSNTALTGTWSSSNAGTLWTFEHAVLSRASGYRMTLAQGSKASDGSYLSQGFNVGFYTEDIVPQSGWNNMGKMLVLSGSDTQYAKNIYLRNLQFMDVNVIALIGK